MLQKLTLTALFMLLLCLAAAAAPPTVRVDPADPGWRSELAILLVNDQSDPAIAQRAQALLQEIGRLKQGNPHVVAYDYNKEPERKYCQGKLGVTSSQLPFLAVVRLENKVPRQVMLAWGPCPPEAVAELLGALHPGAAPPVAAAPPPPSGPTPAESSVDIILIETGASVSLNPDGDKMNRALGVVAAPDHGGRSQRWFLESVGNGAYRVRSAFSGYYIGVDDHQRLIQLPDITNAWVLARQSDGGVVFRAPGSDKVWDVSESIGYLNDSYKPILLYHDNNGGNQRFRIQPDPHYPYGSTASREEMAQEGAALEARSREYQIRALGHWTRNGSRLTINPDHTYRMWDAEQRQDRAGGWDLNGEGKIVLHGANGRGGDLLVDSIDAYNASIGGFPWSR